VIYPNRLLAGIFCLQLLALAVVSYFDATESAAEHSELFLSFAVDSVDKVAISGADGEVALRKVADGWMVGDELPADGAKIAEVLEKLGSLRLTWPVATSPGTQDRFEVAADNHQRFVQLYQGDSAVAEVYLGSSPGYRRVHARQAESNDIYSLDFATFEVPTAANDWLDKALLGAAGPITEISRSDLWTLVKTDAEWVLNDPVADVSVAADQSAANALAERLANLRVLAVADPDAGAEPEESARIQITDSAGAYELQFLHDSAADEYVVTSDRTAGRYTVASYIAEQIIVDAEALAVDASEAPDS
jgi:hypothetical protein